MTLSRVQTYRLVYKLLWDGIHQSVWLSSRAVSFRLARDTINDKLPSLHSARVLLNPILTRFDTGYVWSINAS